MDRALTIGIAGCGIGGMAAALLLARSGHKITLFDQFSAPSPLGSGLVLQPVGMAVLDALGVGSYMRRHGHKIYRMSGTEAKSGRNVLYVDYGPHGGQVYGLGIHRASLFDGLYRALIDSGARLETGCKIIHSRETAAKGRFMDCEDGREFGPFDLVIDSSGARSTLSPIRTRPLPYGALWGTVDWPDTGSNDNTDLPLGRLSQCYRASRHMLGVLPLGKLPGEQTQKAAIFWSQRREDLPQWPKTDIEKWKEQTVKLWPQFSPFVSQINQNSDMTPASYNHGTLRRPYGAQIAYIGDAAHQASPQLGQGANMALLDAFALSVAISQTSSIDEALKTYGQSRRSHVALYQIFSAVFTPFYQSDSRLLPVMRDNIMNPISLMWPMRGLLTKLVCGNLIKP